MAVSPGRPVIAPERHLSAPRMLLCRWARGCAWERLFRSDLICVSLFLVKFLALFEVRCVTF